jgi:hypothetical protein
MWQRTIAKGALVSVLMLFPALAHAQAIGGRVTDSSGGVLPGVSVAVRSPALIEQVRTAVTVRAGQYLIVDLAPGSYSVTFSLSGFSTLRRDGIELTTGFTASVSAELRVGDIAETITVSRQSPVVDVQNTNQQRVMTREVLDAVPTANTFNAPGALIPGIVLSQNSGSQLTQDVGANRATIT